MKEAVRAERFPMVVSIYTVCIFPSKKFQSKDMSITNSNQLCQSFTKALVGYSHSYY